MTKLFAGEICKTKRSDPTEGNLRHIADCQCSKRINWLRLFKTEAVSVSDTGIGINKEALKSIFGSFTQASSETSRKYGGTGLGLAITQKLLELFGSKIQVESEVGKGTYFSFSVNFATGIADSSHLNQAASDETTYELSHFNQQRILLVEDNHVNKIIASKFLSSWSLVVELLIMEG